MSDDDSDDWPSVQNKNKAEKLYKKARNLFKQDEFVSCLETLKQAYNLYPNKKYKEKIKDMEDFIKDQDDDSDSDEDSSNESNNSNNSNNSNESNETSGSSEKENVNMSIEKESDCSKGAIPKKIVPARNNMSNNRVEVDTGLYVDKQIYDKLYPYQRDGLKKLYEWFKNKKGGILADDMGLGKTIQTIVLMKSLFDYGRIKNVLIVAPGSLLQNWGEECRKWAPDIVIYKYHGNERARNLAHVQRHGGVLITTYETARNNYESLATCYDDYGSYRSYNNYGNRPFIWDYMILDEAHKIKNPSKTTRNLHEIPGLVRLAITGTPVQNNLRELWALYDFTMKGTLLGSYQTFKSQYEIPITKAREKCASDRQRRLGTQMADELKEIYKGYFLRRTKAELFRSRKSLASQSVNSSISNSLPPKTDWVVWVKLSKAQENIYRMFLQTDSVKEFLMGANKKSSLVQLTIIKKICDHPRLLPTNAALKLINNSNISQGDIDNLEENNGFTIDDVTDDELMAESGKLVFLIRLLEELKSSGHRTLVFAQSLKILNMIQRILLNKHWSIARLDGHVKIKDRDSIVKSFQTDSKISVCLLTTQVGGVGLTLTGADRVVIYDPSWNPGTDNQAIDRAYRIGQNKPVIVYRLITCGGVEEKIYRRQVFKTSLIFQTVNQKKDPLRYFTNQELIELFKLDDPDKSETYYQLQRLHGHQEVLSDHDRLHREKIKSFRKCFNVSDNALLFSYDSQDNDTNLNDEERVFYENEALKAREKVLKECQANEQHLLQSGLHSRPFTLSVSTKKQNKPKDTTVPEYPVYDIDFDDNQPNNNSINDLFGTVPFNTEVKDQTIDIISQDIANVSLDEDIEDIDIDNEDINTNYDDNDGDASTFDLNDTQSNDHFENNRRNTIDISDTPFVTLRKGNKRFNVDSDDENSLLEDFLTPSQHQDEKNTKESATKTESNDNNNSIVEDLVEDLINKTVESDELDCYDEDESESEVEDYDEIVDNVMENLLNDTIENIKQEKEVESVLEEIINKTADENEETEQQEETSEPIVESLVEELTDETSENDESEEEESQLDEDEDDDEEEKEKDNVESSFNESVESSLNELTESSLSENSNDYLIISSILRNLVDQVVEQEEQSQRLVNAKRKLMPKFSCDLSIIGSPPLKKVGKLRNSISNSSTNSPRSSLYSSSSSLYSPQLNSSMLCSSLIE